MRGLLSIVVVAAALTFVGAPRAAVGQSSYQPTTLTIVTVPRLAGVHLAFDGRTYVTGRQGKVRIETTIGHHLLQILDTRMNTRRVRSTFSRWEDNRYTAARTITIRRNTVVDAGFQQSVRVSFAFADLSGRPVLGRVSRMTLSNTLGSRVSFAPSWPHWLRATGLARSFRGLEPTFVQYSIEQALVNGSNVVNQSQQRFYPAKTRRFTTHLLLYSARVRVRDFLFGTSIGNQLNLVYPDGSQVAYPLRGGNLLLSSLPRGTYALDVHAGGYVPSVSLALSKNQSLDVKVVSYLDMALLLVLVLVSVTVLILIPRPFLRLRLSALGSGRRPTPDDLEPLTPLSRARKKLIARYMPEPDTGRGRPAGSSASRAVSRLPLPTLGPMVVPTSGEGVERPVGKLPSRLFEAAVESLRRRAQRLSDVRGLTLPLRQVARGQVPAKAALSGERIDLINVYMPEQITSPREMAAPAPRQPKAVPNVGAAARGDVPGTTVAPQSPASPAPSRLAPVIALSPAPAVEEKPAEGDAAPAIEEKHAPPRKRTAPARRKRAAPAVEEKLAEEIDEKPGPAVEGDAAPSRRRAAPTGRKRAGATGEESARPAPRKSAAPTKQTRAPAAKTKTSAQPVRKRAPAKKKSTTAANGKSASAVRQSQAPAKQKPKPRTAEKAATAAGDQDAVAGTNGGASRDEFARLMPDLVAAVDALQEELEKEHTSTAEQGRRESSGTGQR